LSILSDRDIARALGDGSIRIVVPSSSPTDPFESWRLQPSSFELTISGRDGTLMGYSKELTEYVNGAPRVVGLIDPEEPPTMTRRSWWRHEPSGRSYYNLAPGEFILASVAEQIRVCSSIAAIVDGKSSLGRLGLFVHVTAGFVDPGWGDRDDRGGVLTLELFNAAPRPIRLWAGMRIAQVRFERLSSPSERPYGSEGLGSHYSGSFCTVQAASVAPRAPEAVCEPGCSFAHQHLHKAWL
jgi:dCTP deaminase